MTEALLLGLFLGLGCGAVLSRVSGPAPRLSAVFLSIASAALFVVLMLR